MIRMIFFVFVLGCFAGCTEQRRARVWGSTASVKLQAGRKLVNATWKADDLWLLTRPMKIGEGVERYEFQESSSWGVLEGTVVIEEVASAVERQPTPTPTPTPTPLAAPSREEMMRYCREEARSEEARELCRSKGLLP